MDGLRVAKNIYPKDFFLIHLEVEPGDLLWCMGSWVLNVGHLFITIFFWMGVDGFISSIKEFPIKVGTSRSFLWTPSQSRVFSYNSFRRDDIAVRGHMDI